ncbi:MAG: 1-acyl-sn-glycerol-3-phosphate acyltransferase [Candidatus Nomurabacteria bacterium]|nr:1-acyl-sn-glycerol-3-phosphate acyltransferase [Candidatus Nomurabacteria bacterium]
MSSKNVIKYNKASRYKSPWRAAVRFVLQRGILKPIIYAILNVKVEGKENLQKLGSKPFILVANHSSHLDVLLCTFSLPWARAKSLAAAAASDYWMDKFWPREFTRSFLNTFPVDRNGKNRYGGLSSRLLETGVSLVIFPEGTRSRTGKLGDFNPGSAALSIRHNVPILPVTLHGTYRAWPAGKSVLYIVRCPRPRVTVSFGVPIYPDNLTVEQLNKKLKTTIEKSLKQK